jgi:hypothetical protein
MPLLQKDIRKLQPPLPQTVRRRDSASPFVTTDSRTSSSQEARPSSATTFPSTRSAIRVSKHPSKSGNESSSSPSSPVVYWSEFEIPEDEPYTVPVDESTALLLPWLGRRKQERDLERQYGTEDPSFLKRTLEKFWGVVEFEIKASADGLWTLFNEKDIIDRGEGEGITDDEESYNSDDSSDGQVESATAEPSHHHHVVIGGHHSIDDSSRVSRSQLLNRGYFLCVIGCTILSCIFGIMGFLVSGNATGITLVLLGFLISMTLEIVSLVRFIMYFPPLVLVDMIDKVDILGLRGLDF